MRSILHAFLVAVAMCVVCHGWAAAEHVVFNVSGSADESLCCDIACSRYPSTVVVWQEGNQGSIVTRSRIGTSWQEPIELGGGCDPVLAWGQVGFALAYIRGQSIVVRTGNGFAWSDSAVFVGDSPLRPDIWVSKSNTADEIYVVWDDNGNEIWFARRTGGVWQAPQAIEVTEMFSDFPTPRVRPRPGPGGIAPRVYYLDYFRIKYCDWTGTTWTEPVAIPCLYSLGTDFDVAEDPLLRHRVLSLLPQPS